MKLIYNGYKTHNIPSSLEQQQGVALIVVLMIVLLISIVGAMAVRSSQTSLNMTTAAQVNQLLVQSSDVPLAHLETAQATPFDTATGPSQLEAMVTENGPIGYLRINGENTPGAARNFKAAEYVLCYQPTERKGLYAGGDAHLVLRENPDGTTGRLKNPNGNCRLDDANAYTSARGVVATQVSVTRPSLDAQLLEGTDVVAGQKQHASKTFTGITGSDSETYSGGRDVKLRTYVTSILPAMAISSTPTQVEACLQMPIGGLADDSSAAKTNQRTCLSRTDTPYNIQVQDFMYIEQP